jgi:mercuric ion transport protein
MDNDKLLKTGLIGTCVAAVCCFTPALVVLVGAIGLSAIIGWLDFVLIPAFFMFLALTGYALYRRNRDWQGSGETV